MGPPVNLNADLVPNVVVAVAILLWYAVLLWLLPHDDPLRRFRADPEDDE